MEIGLLVGKAVSKQAVFERLQQGAVNLGQSLLQEALRKSLSPTPQGLFKAFGKVVVQDSTHLSLPQSLAHFFPGPSTKGVQKATAKIQTALNIKTMQFIDFKLGSFTQNDQSNSTAILSSLQERDLLIRDLGYFVIEAFEQMVSKGIYFLSRLRYGINLYDRQANRLDMKKIVRRKKQVDMLVYMGEKKKVPVRLIMIPLPAERVAERIRKAKQDRDRRLNHCKAYYDYLHFSVYITTIEENIWTAQQIAKAYNIRWQIEIIFKSWKTGLNLQSILHEKCTNIYRVQTSIYLLLLFIVLCMNKIYLPYKQSLEKQYYKQLSLLKLIQFIAQNIMEIIGHCSIMYQKLLPQHCCYDKRKDRCNMADLVNQFKN